MKIIKYYLNLLLFTAGLISGQAQAEITYYHTDFTGSPAVITNEAGEVISRSHYKPYGDSVEGVQQDVGYTGHQHDAELELTYMQARYYDSVIGRFYSNDPVGFVTGSPIHSFNRYTYANNNPYKYTDPNGEFSFLVGGAIGAVASGAAAAISGGTPKQIAIAAAGGFAVGAVTSGLGVATHVGAVMSSLGAGATTSTAVGVVATGAINGAAGNALGQGADMAIDSMLGNEVASFDGGQAMTAGVIGAVGAAVPAIAAASEMGISSSLTGSTFKAVSGVSGLGTTGEAIVGVAAGATEGAATAAINQAKVVYENIK